jgi:hypothetical protein
MLIPKGNTRQTSFSVTDRRKHHRLNGADLYVARLGGKRTCSSDLSNPCCSTSAAIDTDLIINQPQDPTPRTGSLHDELSTPSTLKAKIHPTAVEINTQPSILSSRPCYRCISYMNSAGIKRVFWTTDSGVWEAAKVRDLVDALDTLGNGEACDVNIALDNVFVTKHEVLMLRRVMEDN